LARPANFSAGVFDRNGALVRTLAANERLASGSYSRSWDGRDDAGQNVPPGDYTVRAVTHNLDIKWEGTVGNSSEVRTGVTPFHGLGAVLDIVSLKDSDYMLRDYNERGEWITRFRKANPSRFYPSGERFTGNASPGPAQPFFATSIATDGELIYVAMTEGDYYRKGKGRHIILRFDPDDPTGDALKSFAGLKPDRQNQGGKWLQVGAADGADAAPTTSLAVQSRGTAIAVADHAGGSVRFYDRLSGTPIGWPDLRISRVSVVKWSPDEGTLWASEEATSTVQGWRLMPSGWTRTTTIQLEAPVAGFGVQPRDGSLAVMVAGPVQQIQWFNAEGKQLRSIGKSGGLLSDPVAAPDGFAFLPLEDKDSGFQPGAAPSIGGITFESDGSFWVVDKGNARCEKFSPDGGFQRAISYVPGQVYTQTTDRTDATRLFAGYLEFARNYDVSLVPHSDGSGGAWRLVRNWCFLSLPEGTRAGLIGGRLGATSHDGLEQVVTCRAGPEAGRTFGMLYSSTRQRYDFVELDRSKGLVYRGSFDSARFPHLPAFSPPGTFDSVIWPSLLEDSDGLVFMAAVAGKSGEITIYGQTLSGIKNNLAAWTAPRPYASAPSDPKTGMVRGPGPIGGGIERLSDGTLVTANNADTSVEGRPFIGILAPGGARLINEFARGAYNEPLRRDGTVPIEYPDQRACYPSCGVRVAHDLIVQFDHGEFVDGAQMNQVLLFHRSGLCLGQTGERTRVQLMAVTSGAGGNFTGNSVNELPNGDLVIHANSELLQGGIGEIRVRNVISITEHTASLSPTGSSNLGEIAPSHPIVVAPSPWQHKLLDRFERPDGDQVGNGWEDRNSHYAIQGGQLRLRSGFFGRPSGLEGFLARGNERYGDNEQTLHIPAELWDPAKVGKDRGTPVLSFGLVGRQVPGADRKNGPAYFVEVDYVRPARYASGPPQWTHGMFLLNIYERCEIPGSGLTNYLLAADNWYSLPGPPGHSYTLTFSVTGVRPAVLHAVLRDDVTGQNAELYAENDEPELQSPGRVGIVGRFGGSALGDRYALRW
jgi:hypothetical protein